MPTTSALRSLSAGRGISIVIFSFLSSRAKHALRMLRDHQFLVGRNHPRRDTAARSADARAVAAVGMRVQRDAKPSRVSADALAQPGAVLAHAGRGHPR